MRVLIQQTTKVTVFLLIREILSKVNKLACQPHCKLLYFQELFCAEASKRAATLSFSEPKRRTNRIKNDYICIKTLKFLTIPGKFKNRPGPKIDYFFG